MKFGTTSSMRLNFYVLFQYSVALAITAFFLFNESTFELSIKALMAGGIIVTIMNCGLLFENKNWVKYTEYLKIPLVAVAGVYVAFTNDWNVFFSWLALVIAWYHLYGCYLWAT